MEGVYYVKYKFNILGGRLLDQGAFIPLIWECASM